ncbi:menaquinone-dependent protoporphyrinogen oxidase [Natrinema hispanicum]|uniref:Menaquinone-dependent protoporphyrinogen oxidase n=1 Tax=Natrinema hispanicum TaxID=392421 RepID=A0A1G6VM87_9EURY|nr:menaquinone-dependent protoporphyrinogen oxidase [Natrinema hispanicum]SET92700.1 menaquinone-dependent protoporphyrinogen oxidase [Natrinema hispanicum]
MVSFLIVYGTDEGQTATVAEYIGTVLTDRGHDVTTRYVTETSDSIVDDVDAVLIGSPVINRKHLRAVVAFVDRNREALAAKPTAFFQLSFASAIPSNWARDGAQEWVDALIERTGWQPDRVGLFAGAVKYTRYGPFTRLFFKLFSAVTTGDTDTSRDYEYTDWDEVEAFATDFAALAEQRVAADTPQTDDRVAMEYKRESPPTEQARESPLTKREQESSPTERKRGRRLAEVGLLAGLLSVVYWLVRRQSVRQS